MKRLIFFLIVTFLFVHCKRSHRLPDFSGVDAFWEITAALKMKKEPTAGQWKVLEKSPGYAALFQDPSQKEAFQKACRLAFDPSLRVQRNLIYQEDKYVASLVRHLVRVGEKETELRTFQQKLPATFHWDSAIARAQQLLPAGLTRRSTPPAAIFIFFFPGEQLVEGKIIADLLFVMEEPAVEGFLAHQLYHFYYSGMTTGNKSFAAEDQILMDRLLSMVEEGLADMMDKREIPFIRSDQMRDRFPGANYEFYSEYRHSFLDGTRWIQLMINGLQRIVLFPEQKEAISRQLFDIFPLQGRTVIAYMVRTIIDQLGAERLTATLDHPLRIFALYNEAALKAGIDTYPKDVLLMLNELEQKYEL